MSARSTQRRGQPHAEREPEPSRQLPHAADGRLRTLALVVPNDDHRTGSMLDHLLADRPKQKAREASSAAVADHDEICTPCFFEESFSRLPVHRLPFTLEVRLQTLCFCSGLTSDGLGIAAKRVEHRGIHPWSEPACIRSRGDLPGADDAKKGSTQRSLGDSELERCVCTARPIHPRHDRVHQTSILFGKLVGTRVRAPPAREGSIVQRR
jgi:hypothetical protein